MLKQRFTNLLSTLGFQRVKPSFAAALVIMAFLVIFQVLYQITSSAAISISFTICVFVQFIDLVRTRLEKIKLDQNLEWPKFLDAIHSASWAGASFAQALLDSKKFAPRHGAWAFEEFSKDVDSGVDLDSALLNLKARLDTPVSDRFVEITRLANQSSGNGYLAALRSQSIQLRAENTTWQEVSTKQNWVISSGRLAVFAPWLTLLLLCSRHETSQAFSTSEGMTLLLVGLFLSLFAFRLISFLGKLPTRLRVLK